MNGYNLQHFVVMLYMLNDDCKNMFTLTQTSKVNRILENKKKLVCKKEVPGFQTVEQLLRNGFV